MKKQVTNKPHKYHKFKELILKQSVPKEQDDFAFDMEKIISFVALLDEIERENIKFKKKEI